MALAMSCDLAHSTQRAPTVTSLLPALPRNLASFPRFLQNWLFLALSPS